MPFYFVALSRTRSRFDRQYPCSPLKTNQVVSFSVCPPPKRIPENPTFAVAAGKLKLLGVSKRTAVLLEFTIALLIGCWATAVERLPWFPAAWFSRGNLLVAELIAAGAYR